MLMCKRHLLHLRNMKAQTSLCLPFVKVQVLPHWIAVHVYVKGSFTETKIRLSHEVSDVSK